MSNRAEFSQSENLYGDRVNTEVETFKNQKTVPNLVIIGSHDESRKNIENFLEYRLDKSLYTIEYYNYRQYVEFIPNSVVIFLANSIEEILHTTPVYWRRSGARAIIVIAPTNIQNCCEYALEEYADDFLRPPISNRELLARIRSIWRGLNRPVSKFDYLERYRFSNFIFDRSNYTLTHLSGRSIIMRSYSFRILNEFITYPNRIFTRASLMAALGERCSTNSERSIDVQIYRLRKHLGSEGANLIKMVRGQGYKFCAEVTRC